MVRGADANETIFRRAAELGIFPTVRTWMAGRGDDVTACRAGWKRHLIAHAFRLEVLGQIIDAFGSEVEFVVLKGAPLARELYGDASARQSGDIDLLVERSDRAAAAEILEELGFRASAPLDDDANREREFIHSDHGLLVDLHWSIAFPWVPTPDTSALLASRTDLLCAGRRVPVLERTHRLIHLLLHFHDHVGFAKGLLDVAAFLDVHGPEVVERAADELDELGLLGVASWPLATLRQLGLDSPAPLSTDMPVQLWSSWSARSIDGVLGQSEPIDARHPLSFKIGAITRGEQVLLKGATMALLDRRRDRLRAMAAPIMSSPGAIARKRGRDRAGALDWARWALRPASLVARQIAELTQSRRSR